MSGNDRRGQYQNRQQSRNSLAEQSKRSLGGLRGYGAANGTASDVNSKSKRSLALSDYKSDTDVDLIGNTAESNLREQIVKAEFKSVTKWKIAVSVSLVATSALIVIATYIVLSQEEKNDFETSFNNFAGTVSIASQFHATGVIHSYQSMADSITSQVLEHGKSYNNGTAMTMIEEEWPFVYVPNVDVKFSNLRQESFSEYIGFSPIVDSEYKQMWESYSVTNAKYWIEEDGDRQNTTAGGNNNDIPLHIHLNKQYIEDNSNSPYYLPVWQMSPQPTDLSVINHNLLSDPFYENLLQIVKTSGHSTVSGIINNVNNEGKKFHHQVVTVPGDSNGILSQKQFGLSGITPGAGALSATSTTKSDNYAPNSIFIQPIYNSFHKEDRNIVGILEGLLSWDLFFEDILPKGVGGIIAVIDDSCSESFTYEINEKDDDTTKFLGMGDLHETKFDEHRVEVHLSDFFLGNGAVDLDPNGQQQQQFCYYKMNLYPSTQFHSIYHSKGPDIFTASLAIVFCVTGIAFFIFLNCLFRHIKRLILSAEKSNTIVSALFPKNVRERIMEDVEEQVQKSMEQEGRSHSFFKEAPKLRLKSYLNKENENNEQNNRGENGGNNQDGANFFNTKPIADLFPEATVLFADIVGFTAWSSVREPSQVFQLLETIYFSFDNIAKRRRVFKVETVGDCYVAATGLPDPRKDHALVMCRFARECMHSVHDLTKKLEVTLGPDTGDLTMRFGLHSGPVTAGVLRGEKSRFQLFGDTMNTASRIETTGLRDKIHLSQETADLITVSGKGKWVTPRDKKVLLKGKGEVQTYWLSMSSGNNLLDISTSEHYSSTLSSSLKQMNDKIPTEPQWANHVTPQNNDGPDSNGIVLDPKMERLVKWNVAQLLQLLKPIVARRNCLQKKLKIASNGNTITQCTVDKNCTVLEEVKEIIELPKFDAKTFRLIEDPDLIELTSDVVNQLHDYVTNICKMYKADNPFHNFEHASHVTMSVSKLLSRITAPEDIIYDDGDLNANQSRVTDKVAAAFHDHTYGITSDPLTQFAVAFSALIHDVDHSGVPNSQLIVENKTLASRYKNKSVAEQHSVDMAWDLLMREKYSDLRDIIYSNQTEFLRFRQFTVNSVMATDIVDKGLKELRDSRWAKAFSQDGTGQKTPQDLDDDRNRKATIVIEHLIQASDVAHTMQHWHVYRKWNERFFFEMYKAYKSGRSERDPSTMWYKGEIGFFDFYIIPLARKLKDCGVFGVSSEEYLNFALNNRAEWVAKGEAVVEEMLEKAVKEL